VDDLGAVDVDEAFGQLRDEELRLIFVESLLLLEEFIEGVVATEFEQHVHILIVFENMFEPNNSSMFQHFVDFDFGDELHMGSSTFCLALAFLRFYLLMILIAHIFLVLRLVASKHRANPPFPRNFPFM
jgi:hypothetical protein